MGLFKNSPGRGAPGHGKGYKYKKRFNATVSVTSNGLSLPSNPSSFAGTYGGGGRPTVMLNSVIIEEGDVYGHLTKAQVTFTCFSYGAFKNTYVKMLELGKDCSISIGYAESGAPSGGKTFGNMFVYKFDWKLTKDNYVEATFSAMSASPLIDQHPVNNQSKLANQKFQFQAILEAGGEPQKVFVQSLAQYMMYLAQGAGSTPTKDIQPGFGNGILVLNNPLTKVAEDPAESEKVINIVNGAGGNLSYDNSKLVYCTLQWLVDQLNTWYLPEGDTLLNNTKYLLGSTAYNAGCVDGSICSSDPLNILICGNDSGDYGIRSNLPEEEQLLADAIGPVANNVSSINCANILLSTSYLASAVFGDAQLVKATSDAAKNPSDIPEKPSFTFEKLFKTIFDDIFRVTGGAVHLVTLSPTNPNDTNRFIEAMNHNDAASYSPAVFDPFSGNQAIRLCEISCAPASKDAYAIALKSRTEAAGAMGVNGDTVPPAGADREAAIVAIQEARTSSMLLQKFSSAAVDGLRQQLAKLVSSAGSQAAATGKVPHQSAQFPLNLQLTTDGVTGFRFGDLITTTLNPRGQDGSRGCFVITKIIHTVQQNDWETKFETSYMLI